MGATLRSRLGAAVAALALALAVMSAAASADERVPADAATTKQKAVFVGHLVTKSVSATRIEESGDAEAKASLDRARSLVDEAHGELGRGAYEAADDKLDEALALLNSEVRRLTHDEVSNDHDKRMYDRRLNAVETFLAAYQRVAESGTSRAAANQARELRGQINKAKSKAGAGDYDAAAMILDDAYRLARGDIQELREGKTLVRSLEFATAEEEYDYELGRNESHFVLLQFALSDKNPQGSVLGRIKQNRDQAKTLRASAESEARSGEFAEAIGRLNESTEMLIKSIRMSGLFIPG